MLPLQLTVPYFVFEIMLAVWDSGGIAVGGAWLTFLAPVLLGLVRGAALPRWLAGPRVCKCVSARRPHSRARAWFYAACTWGT
jgi:hypothetical protein